MKATQLSFDFGKSVLRHVRLLPEAPPAPPSPRRPHLRRDPVLEKLSAALLRQCGCRGLAARVAWNTRLRTTAGLACWQTKTIMLNPRLLEIAPGEIQRTLRHELAHFVAQFRAGRRRIAAHGHEWRQACRDLGIPREPRCHDLPFKRIRHERKHFYVCRNCGSRIARVRPFRRPAACLRCCRKHNGGRYHENFRYVATTPPAERKAA
ncbi:MAG: SprT-like domain-containing protein [Terrimicrobiaceae bacterium]|nr:SprT-like domain-containing protein [Terrimicrobiaceae bacterium]